MKIYFAAADSDYIVNPLLAVGVKYALTSYEKWRGGDTVKFNSLRYDEFTSVIVDSGLFSYLWGKKSQIDYDRNFYYTYLDNYSKFIEASRFENMRYVELDVQQKLGVDFAWELREKLVERFGKSKVINVCHAIDGDPVTLVKYSDYIAISSAILWEQYGKDYFLSYVDYLYRIGAENNTKIHLFGLTRPEDVQICYGATSCDSTSWASKLIWGRYAAHNYFHGRGGHLDIRSTGQLIELMEGVEKECGVILGRVPSEKQFYYAAYSAFLYYKQLMPNSVT